MTSVRLRCSVLICLNPRPGLEVWRDVTEAQGALLHPLNLWRSKSLEALVTASVNMRQWSAALAPARENEAAIRSGELRVKSCRS